eukprot:Protomagalhaensia_wolfi_Nauph_80__4470@NODE_457_length_2485_cov_384_355683_g343_i0_p1_GENE_NODE_457_length_2485_cov_384_355683_g343_i0NODE_457_length_2485_cov_384_355683_g343_i0_p1_ORF_typecomplete_len297_score31_39FAM24/PF15193_6/3_5e03FAM24/PF15193_6/0_25_NODE_457_length_2485_cov_384_355683_g343_i015732463
MSDTSPITSINCASGRSLVDCQMGQTSQQCQSMCTDVCASVTDEAELDECLSSSLFLCCSFSVDVSELLVGMNPVAVSKTEWYSDVDLTTQQIDWGAIKIADLVVSATDPISAACVDSVNQVQVTAETAVGILLAWTVPFTWRSNILDLSILTGWQSITSPYNGIVRVRVLLLDAATDCQITPTATELTLTSRSTATYRTRESCKTIQTCTQCRAAGCDWCFWTTQAISLLPPWAPDWSWVNEARSRGGALCGVHTHVCSESMGTQNACRSGPMLLGPTLLGPSIMLLLLFSLLRW